MIAVNELEFEKIRNNPEDRCYICKKGLFQKMLEFAERHGIATIYEGSNYDDLSQYRPGMKAVKELGISSPLLEHGFTKKEIREWATSGNFLGFSSVLALYGYPASLWNRTGSFHTAADRGSRGSVEGAGLWRSSGKTAQRCGEAGNSGGATFSGGGTGGSH